MFGRNRRPTTVGASVGPGARRPLVWNRRIGSARPARLDRRSIVVVDVSPAFRRSTEWYRALWIFAYGLSLGPISVVYLGETSTTRLRAQTISIATTAAGLLELLATYCTPLLVSNRAIRLCTTCTCLHPQLAHISSVDLRLPVMDRGARVLLLSARDQRQVRQGNCC